MDTRESDPFIEKGDVTATVLVVAGFASMKYLQFKRRQRMEAWKRAEIAAIRSYKYYLLEKYRNNEIGTAEYLTALRKENDYLRLVKNHPT